MISLQLVYPASRRPLINAPSNTPMMTGHCPRKHLPRPPHAYSPKRPTIRHNPLHHIRSFLLPRILLSIFPLKPGANPRTRRPMTPSGHQTTQPHRSPATKHSYPPSFGRNCHMSSPQHHRGKPKTRHPRPNTDNPPRVLLHRPTGNRVPRSPILNCRQRLRLHFLCCHRIPRTPRNHWIHLLNRLPPPPNQIPLHIRPPLRI